MHPRPLLPYTDRVFNTFPHTVSSVVCLSTAAEGGNDAPAAIDTPD